MMNSASASSFRGRTVARLAANLLRVMLGLALAVTVSEILLGFLASRDKVPGCTEMRWFRQGSEESRNSFVLDPEFGFRPRLDTALMNAYGTRVDRYAPEKPAGKTRLLFAGDSVTFRGFIIDALKSLCGEERFEYWNAGVESFNTIQEVRFYRRFNRPLHPDHVILSFHNNDFESIPVAFRDKGKLVVYSTAAPARTADSWLFQESNLYRFLFGISGLAISGFSTPSPRAVRETENSLMELRDMLDEDGAHLSVVLLPLCKPYRQWTQSEIRSREEALRIFKKQGIRHYDLLPVLEQAASEGLRLQERTGDPWHPSKELAGRFAESLRDAGLLAETGTRRTSSD